MGRIRTTLIKRVAKKLLQEHGEEFGTDFNKNKEIVDRYLKVSKKMRNVIAGYIVKLKKSNTK
jgi:small subunit ribosomal protein S17e